MSIHATDKALPPQQLKERFENRKLLFGLVFPFSILGLTFSMLAVAIPPIRTLFSIQTGTVAWLILAYYLPVVVLMPLYGRLGDGLGKPRMFIVSLTFFSVGVVISLVAPSLGVLIVGRIIQGVGGAGVYPLCMSLIAERFPARERAKAFGLWNAVGPAMGVVGPLMAGFLVEHFGWRSIFVPVLVMSLLAIFMVRRLIRGGEERKSAPAFLRSFDWTGVSLLGIGLVLLVFFVSSRPITGVAPLRDLRLFVPFLLLFGAVDSRS